MKSKTLVQFSHFCLQRSLCACVCGSRLFSYYEPPLSGLSLALPPLLYRVGQRHQVL